LQGNDPIPSEQIILFALQHKNFNSVTGAKFLQDMMKDLAELKKHQLLKSMYAASKSVNN
jgi:hypothetical protein